jgi:hypothetical protein
VRVGKCFLRVTRYVLLSVFVTYCLRCLYVMNENDVFFLCIKNVHGCRTVIGKVASSGKNKMFLFN